MHPMIETELVRLVRLARSDTPEATRQVVRLRRTARHLRDDRAEVACLRLLALLAKGSGNRVRASLHYEAILRIRPGDVAAHLGLAHSAEVLGRLEKSRDALRRARTLVGGDPVAEAAIDEDLQRVLRKLKVSEND